VLCDIRDKTTVWMSVNSKKRTFNKFGKKMYSGTDVGIDSITHIFIDIDRVKKEGPATNEELKQCDMLAYKVLKKLDEHGFANNYAKICSGNGIQLLIKLDVPIILPIIQYEKVGETTLPLYNEEFERIKRVIKNGIGKQMLKFSNSFKEQLGAEIDSSCFGIGKVCSLPWSKNFKYDGFTWRGIIELKTGENVGLTDYIMNSIEDEKSFIKNPIYGKPKREYRTLKPGKLRENELINFMLTTDLQSGINNTLWAQLKCLLRDSKINLNDKEWRQIHEELKTRHKRTFTLNFPEEHFEFHPDVINHYCIEHGIPPVYPLWKLSRPLITDMCLEELSWKHLERISPGKKVLPTTTTIWDDMEDCKKELVMGSFDNKEKVVFFLRGVIDKYGEVRAKYLLLYVLKDYFSRSSK
jgi:hypothetical protein